MLAEAEGQISYSLVRYSIGNTTGAKLLNPEGLVGAAGLEPATLSLEG